MSPMRQILAACLLASSLTSVLSTQASERQSHSVEVTFYQLSTSEWSNVETAFKTLLAADIKTYCTNDMATCGLTSGDLFTASEVGIASGPTEESKSLKISFYVDYPVVHVTTGSATTTYVVNSDVVKTVLTNSHESLEDVVGCDITYIATDFYGIAPAATLNKVLIPIAFIVLLGIIILAVALHMWNKRKEQEAKKKQRALDREKRKKTSRITPIYTMENEGKKSNWLQRSKKKKKKQGSTNGQATNGNVPVLSLKTNMMTLDSGASVMAGANNEEPVPLRTNTLPPLPMSEEEAEGKKDKKRKKHDKRQRSAKKEGGEEGRDESENDFSKSESLEKNGENIIPVEDEPQVKA